MRRSIEHGLALSVDEVLLIRWLLRRLPKEDQAELRARWPAVAIVEWVELLRTPLTMEAIRMRWKVSRATAYRWLAVLEPRRQPEARAL